MEGRGCCGISTALKLTSRAVSAWSACTVERSVCDFGLYGVAGRLSSDSLAVSAQAVLPLAQEGTAMDVEEHGCREANLWPVAIAGRREARLRSPERPGTSQVKSRQLQERLAAFAAGREIVRRAAVDLGCWNRFVLMLPAIIIAVPLFVAMAFETRFATRLAAFEKLFPSEELSLRNAASRTDGYWPFVARKEEPPMAFTYGEFPLSFFSLVLDRACAAAGRDRTARSELSFLDIGSGAGRLVLWAAVTHKWKAVRGIEVLPGLHRAACKKLEAALDMRHELELRTIPEFLEGSWDDASVLPWAEVDVSFAYTTAFPHGEDAVLHDLTSALAARLRRGCIVCTTDYRLGTGFELVDSLEGDNEGVGGRSIVYMYRKTCEGATAAEVLAEQLAASKQQVDLLTARVAALEAELQQSAAEVSELRAEREELRKTLELDEESDASDLRALKEWASESGYLQ